VPEVVYIRQKSPALLWRSIVTAFGFAIGAVITVLSILSLMAVVLAAMASMLVRVP
jgi:hypothetical protein